MLPRLLLVGTGLVMAGTVTLFLLGQLGAVATSSPRFPEAEAVLGGIVVGWLMLWVGFLAGPP